MGDESVEAFVPGHVTAFFSPHAADDPTRAGSSGAGITLTDGVTVRVEPANETHVTVNGAPVPVEPVERVLDAFGTRARVVAETPLPLGAGFGVSGALALGTALSANHAIRGTRSENELVAMAHAAEVAAGTGLGDVVAQARGGIPIRLLPGAPGHGSLDGIPTTARIEYLSFGDRPTAAILSGETDALAAAGESALERLRERPTVETLFAAGRDFAREADLLTPRVEDAIEAVVDGGGQATMAMLGETVVAVDTGLTDAGYDPVACRTHPSGATLRMN